MNSMVRSILVSTCMLLATTLTNAQVGIGTNSPNTSAQLEMRSSSKGFLPPRVALTATNAAGPISSPATGLLVYNTATAGTAPNDVVPGYYYNSGTESNVRWTRLSDGKTDFQSTQIGNKIWMNENLNVNNYRDGTTIPQVIDDTEWSNLTTGAWCWYNNNSANGDVYGKLYNWYAVADSRGLCPTGWHVPTDAEWTLLETTLGGNAGGKLKAAGTSLWTTPNTGATNSSGFAGLPGSFRSYMGTFNNLGNMGFWWSATEVANYPSDAYYRYLGNNTGTLIRNNYGKSYGFAVRCIKD